MARSSTTWSKGETAPGGGRPRRAVESMYSEIFKEACTPAQWLKICKRATADALKGDRYARAFLAEYLLPKPPQSIELSAVESVLLAQALIAVQAIGIQPTKLFTDMITEAHMRLEAGNHEPE